MTTATKAVAGGIAANLVTIALWLISLFPGWSTVPEAPKAAIIALVSSAIGAAVVYFAPPNREVIEPTRASANPLGLQPTEAK